jgi:aspartate carbamoyltransferase catalytic subunit
VNILTVQDVLKVGLLELFQEAEALRAAHSCVRRGHCTANPSGCERTVVANLFFEPSTRTRLSFESAITRLGGKPICSADCDGLSTRKGESIAQTIEVVSRYADVVVVRANISHKDWFTEHGDYPVPVINAGDSYYNHPTQAMLDAYTLWRAYGNSPRSAFVKEPLVHCVIGDIAKSRTIRSYVELMAQEQSHTFYLYDSTGHGNKLPWAPTPTTDLIYLKDIREVESKMKQYDVLYLNRIQTERSSVSIGVLERQFCLTEQHMLMQKDYCLVLNPGPCLAELPTDLHKHPRVKVREQVDNGMYVRMALLKKLLSQR